MKHIIFTHECHKCAAEMKYAHVFIGKMELPIDMLGQSEFTCQECGELHVVGDIDIRTEDEC